MVWKPKAKALTLEEAIALAKAELKPFWFGSEPLIAAVKDASGSSVRPLDANFTKKHWLIFLLDPMEYASEYAFTLSREWGRRYNPYNVGVIVIMRSNYSFMRLPNAISAFLKKQQFTFPVALDSDGLLNQALRADTVPKVLLLNQGQTHFERAGKDWYNTIEAQLQVFLRIADPGLPLLPLLDVPRNIPQDVSSMELGKDRGTTFPKPGFASAPEGYLTGHFRGERPSVMRKGAVYLSGKWLQDAEKIATSDPKAWLSFSSPSPKVGIVAQTLAKSADGGRVYIDLNDAPVKDVFAGEGLLHDDDGQTFIRVDSAGLYPMLSGLTDRKKDITLHFLNADRVPIALYGIRFAQ